MARRSSDRWLPHMSLQTAAGGNRIGRQPCCGAARNAPRRAPVDRTPRAVTLTDDGPRFHAQIGPLLAAIEEPRTKCPAPLPRYAVGSASMSTRGLPAGCWRRACRNFRRTIRRLRSNSWSVTPWAIW
jgi:hypothetical protein